MTSLNTFKKTTLALIAGLMLAAPMALPAQAADVKVGIVDVQKILGSSKLMAEMNKAQQEVASAEQRLAKEYDNRLKQLQEKRPKLSEEDFVKLKRQFEDEMNKMKDEEEKKLISKREAITKIKDQLEKDLDNAVRSVAGKRGLELVFAKQLVIYGGQDITQDVINALPK